MSAWAVGRLSPWSFLTSLRGNAAAAVLTIRDFESVQLLREWNWCTFVTIILQYRYNIWFVLMSIRCLHIFKNKFADCPPLFCSSGQIVIVEIMFHSFPSLVICNPHQIILKAVTVNVQSFSCLSLKELKMWTRRCTSRLLHVIHVLTTTHFSTPCNNATDVSDTAADTSVGNFVISP